MPKFYIYETLLCEVTFVREIEATDADDAVNTDLDTPGRLLGVAVGDAHPSSMSFTDVLPAAQHNLPHHFYAEPTA